jgi:hypothetical protein
VLFDWTHQRLAPRLRITRAGSIGGSTSLRILVLYANPVTASFGATLHREVVKTLRSRALIAASPAILRPRRLLRLSMKHENN